MQFDLVKMEDSTVGFDLRIEPEEVDLSERFLTLKSSVSFAGKVKKEDWITHVSGSAEAIIERSCDRCLRKVDDSVAFEVENVYVYFESLDKDRETELEIAGHDYSVCGTTELDLKKVFCEQLLLAIPDRFVCGDDCKGLCPDCGRRIEEDTCSCGSQEIDPRWAALKNLKVK